MCVYRIMNNNRSSTNYGALSSRNARACESCLKRRARWFCPADDAFLCHPCDSSVHSANELASRHTRVRLDSSSSTTSTTPPSLPNVNGTWHCGFTKKARTPRRPGRNNKNQHDCGPSATLLVPEMESELHHHLHQQTGADSYYSIINAVEENDHELGFSVPVLDNDPFESSDPSITVDHQFHTEFDFSMVQFDDHHHQDTAGGGCNNNNTINWDNLPDLDKVIVGDFETVVDLDVKTEEEEEVPDINFDYDAVHWDSEIFGEPEKKVELSGVGLSSSSDDDNKSRKKILMLRLDYDEVIRAWASQGSPAWEEAWSSSSSAHLRQCGGEGYGNDQHQGINDVDGGREARVMRYKEKRKNRLFAKKIRYQVRKLNAEKRPRLKGRFVKRTTSTMLPVSTTTKTSVGRPELGIGVGVGSAHPCR